jgi:hypothetical protein
MMEARIRNARHRTHQEECSRWSKPRTNGAAKQRLPIHGRSLLQIPLLAGSKVPDSRL